MSVADRKPVVSAEPSSRCTREDTVTTGGWVMATLAVIGLAIPAFRQDAQHLRNVLLTAAISTAAAIVFADAGTNWGGGPRDYYGVALIVSIATFIAGLWRLDLTLDEEGNWRPWRR